MNRAQKEAYKRDYAAAKADGKPFFPYAVYKDLIVASIAIGFVIFLAIWAKAEVGPVIDPATEDYVPRPEWYFFFLFELLRIFKNQDALRPVIMGTFIIPNVLMGLLLLWPFIDRGPERRIWKRPISVMVGVAAIWFLGYMTYLGATTPEGGVAEGTPLPVTIPESDTDAIAGGALWQQNCTACHQIGAQGAGGPGPNLTNEASKGRGIQWQIDHLKNPSSLVPGSAMPPFTNFTDEQYTQLATFLEGLGTKYK